MLDIIPEGIFTEAKEIEIKCHELAMVVRYLHHKEEDDVMADVLNAVVEEIKMRAIAIQLHEGPSDSKHSSSAT